MPRRRVHRVVLCVLRIQPLHQGLLLVHVIQGTVNLEQVRHFLVLCVQLEHTQLLVRQHVHLVLHLQLQRLVLRRARVLKGHLSMGLHVLHVLQGHISMGLRVQDVPPLALGRM